MNVMEILPLVPINYQLSVSRKEKKMVNRLLEDEFEKRRRKQIITGPQFRSAFITASGLNHTDRCNQTADTV